MNEVGLMIFPIHPSAFILHTYLISTIPGVRLTSGSPPLSVTSTQPPQLVSKVPSALWAIGFRIKTLPASRPTSRLRMPRFCGVNNGPSSP